MLALIMRQAIEHACSRVYAPFPYVILLACALRERACCLRLPWLFTQIALDKGRVPSKNTHSI